MVEIGTISKSQCPQTMANPGEERIHKRSNLQRYYGPQRQAFGPSVELGCQESSKGLCLVSVPQVRHVPMLAID